MTIIPRLCRIRNKITNQEFKVFYVGTNTGRIYKIVQFMRDGEAKSKLLDIFEIATNEAIQVIEISQKHKSLYVSTNHRIKQIALEMCNHRYDSCFRCVKDPYCGWDQEANACKPYGIGLLQVRSHYFSLNKNNCLDVASSRMLPTKRMTFVIQVCQRTKSLLRTDRVFISDALKLCRKY